MSNVLVSSNNYRINYPLLIEKSKLKKNSDLSFRDMIKLPHENRDIIMSSKRDCGRCRPSKLGNKLMMMLLS